MSVLGALGGSGALPSVVSTLQQVYGFSSTAMGAVMATGDAVALVISIPLGHYGMKYNKAKLAGIGFIITSFGLLMFALPQFTEPKYNPIGAGPTNELLCTASGSGNTCASGVASKSAVLGYFIVAQILTSSGLTPLLSLIPTYLQENVEKHELGLHLAWQQVGFVLGPAIGFLLTGMLLSAWINLGTAPYGLKVGDAAWAGAWWLPFIFAAAIAFAISWIGLLFPKHMDNTEHIRAALETSPEVFRSGQVDADAVSVIGQQDSGKYGSYSPRESPVDTISPESSDVLQLPQPDRKPSPTLLQSLRVVFTHKVTMLVTAASVCDALIVNAFSSFLPKFFQAQWSLTPGFASILTGIIVVPGAAGGALFGGWMIKRFKMSVSTMTKAAAGFSTVSTLLLFCLLLRCPTQKVSGINFPYRGDGPVITPSPDSLCNADCHCGSHVQYNPVCGSDGVTYYAPCYAGCTDHNTTTDMLHHCGCVADSTQTATVGVCSSSCSTLLPVCVLAAIAMFTLFCGHAPALNIVMRSLPPEHVSVGLSSMQAVWKLLGSFPGPVIMGRIFDSKCLYLSRACDGSGACVLYDNTGLSDSSSALAIICKAFTSIFFVLAWWVYRVQTQNGMVLGGPIQTSPNGDTASVLGGEGGMEFGLLQRHAELVHNEKLVSNGNGGDSGPIVATSDLRVHVHSQ